MTDKESQRSGRSTRAVWMTCGAVSPLVYAVLSYATEVMRGRPNGSLGFWALGLFLAGFYRVVRYPHRHPRLRPFMRGLAITTSLAGVAVLVAAAVFGWEELGFPSEMGVLFAVLTVLQVIAGLYLIFGKRPRGATPSPTTDAQPPPADNVIPPQLPAPEPGRIDGDFRELYDRPAASSGDGSGHRDEPRPFGAEEETPSMTGKRRRTAALVGGGAAVALFFTALGIGLGVLIARGPATTTEPVPTVTTTVPITATAPRTTTTAPRTTTTAVRTTTTAAPSSTTANRLTASCEEIGEWASDEYHDELVRVARSPGGGFRQVSVDVETTREVRPPTIRAGERVCAAELRWRVGQGVNSQGGRDNLYVCANRTYSATAGVDSDPEDCLAVLRGER